MLIYLKNSSLFILILSWITTSSYAQNKSSEYDKKVFILPEKVEVSFKQQKGKWGLMVTRDNKPLLNNAQPIEIEIFADGKVVDNLSVAYDNFEQEAEVYTAFASVDYEGAKFIVQDQWRIHNDALIVHRDLSVHGSVKAGFMSGITLSLYDNATRDEVDMFAPGMIYGGTDNLTPKAIGGSRFKDFIRIREDRLPAPMLGARFNNGLSLTVLNSKPDGRTTREDSRDVKAKPLIDPRLRFGSLGADFDQPQPSFGYWFPGSEGSVTYEGMTYPHGQMETWSRRYHPIQNGLKQQYQVSFRITLDKSFPDYYANAWRWAWDTLKPQVIYHDLKEVRRWVLKATDEMVWTRGGATGILHGINVVKGNTEGEPWFQSRMGFAGRALEAAGYLLADSRRKDCQNPKKYREQAEATMRTFLKLKMAPPEAEGVSSGGKPFTKNGEIFLRSMGDGHKALMQCVLREKKAGVNRAEWVQWSQSFADWLLTQELEGGGFPRIWEHKTGRIIDKSPHSSYTVIVFLSLLSEITNDQRYAEVAIRTAEFCWKHSHSKGIFIGGTSDNPDIIDKEAGTLSLEAYLALYQYTKDKKWLKRAKVAANFSETWIYIWNVPMPADEKNSELGWKKGVSTVGLQLIATGHSLADGFMAFDADEFAELYLKTKDRHYYDVSKILLHNTKSMLSLPGREYDLQGLGWKQEHYSVGPVRGVGVSRAFVGWVPCSILNGIIELVELDPKLYKEMAGSQINEKKDGSKRYK